MRIHADSSGNFLDIDIQKPGQARPAGRFLSCAPPVSATVIGAALTACRWGPTAGFLLQADVEIQPNIWRAVSCERGARCRSRPAAIARWCRRSAACAPRHDIAPASLAKVIGPPEGSPEHATTTIDDAGFSGNGLAHGGPQFFVFLDPTSGVVCFTVQQNRRPKISLKAVFRHARVGGAHLQRNRFVDPVSPAASSGFSPTTSPSCRASTYRGGIRNHGIDRPAVTTAC